MDKTEAIITYLLNCPQIRDNPLFFNFAKAEDNNKQIVTISNDIGLQRPYIDGSVLKRFTFTLIDYRSVSYQALVKLEGYENENVTEYIDVQGIIDWVNTQQDLRNFPDFGSSCEIDNIKALDDSPNLNGLDSNVTPQLAKYSISVQVEYIDNSKKLWRE